MSTMNENSLEIKQTKEKAQTFLLWLGIGSIAMLFAALTSAYIVRKGDGNWLTQYLPQTFYYSTSFLLMSSLTMNWALSSIKKNNIKTVQRALILTLILGTGFVFYQFTSWKDLVSHQIFFSGSNASGSYLYALTGIHLLHLIGGFIGLIVVLIKSYLNKYSAENYHGIKLCAIYWHFLDFLWVYLLLFLLFIR